MAGAVLATNGAKIPMTDANKTSGAECAHNWHDSSNKPGTVWCNRCAMVSAAGSEGVPYVVNSGEDVDVLKSLKRFANVESPLYTAVAALIEREAALAARNAELERERDALRKMWQQAEQDIKDRDAANDALAAEVKALRDANGKLTSPPVGPRRAPVQRYHGKTVPWEVHGLAWEGYCRDYGSGCQSAERIAERGGFGVGEMDKYLPDWRERAAAIDARASAATGDDGGVTESDLIGGDS